MVSGCWRSCAAQKARNRRVCCVARTRKTPMLRQFHELASTWKSICGVVPFTDTVPVTGSKNGRGSWNTA
eukprot:531703-Amphidinium_carterae.1